MTEITRCRYLPNAAAHPVRWGAFLGAAILAPLTLAGAGVIGLHIGLMLTVISALMSLPGYVFLGLPAAWLAIRQGPDSNGRTPDLGLITVYALVAVGMLMPLGIGFMMLFDGMSFAKALDSAMGYTVGGLIFGPIEALLFAYWYRRFTRDDVPATDPQVFN